MHAFRRNHKMLVGNMNETEKAKFKKDCAKLRPCDDKDPFYFMSEPGEVPISTPAALAAVAAYTIGKTALDADNNVKADRLPLKASLPLLGGLHHLQGVREGGVCMCLVGGGGFNHV